MDLASKDSYIQKLASRVISQRNQEPRKRPFVPFKGKSDADPPKKKKKCKKKHTKDEVDDRKPPKSQQKPSPSPTTQKSPATVKQDKSKTENVNGSATQKSKGGNVDASFSTVDVLRKRLHEKIEASRGQGTPKDSLSEAVQAKRAKRKLERERKKRKRKEFLMKKKAEQSGQEQPPEIKEEKQQPAPVTSKKNVTAIVYNKVETVEEGYIDKMQKKKMKKQSMKGQLTPLTGKNYKQLLKRVEARKEKLQELREKDEEKAKEMETKIKWTNMLYKAEGLKIKDDENMLRSSLKKKEKSHAQKKKRWDQRTENVVGKMQQRQDKRRKNIQKRNAGRIEKKKDKARKRGRVLPEDLKKASV